MQKKIMIIDSDEFYIEIISTTIKLFLRQQVLAANTLEDAWEMIEAETPDLIVISLDMPGRIGFDLIERLHDQADTKTIPVLSLSSQEEKQAEAEGIGCTAFMHKPFKTRELEAEIVRLLQM